ncbi:MAG TPA: hypothetical protein VFC63_14855 [Blastocatellia bacterium]|nr:hypothetical protein [Blastocatellia bacterium]
MGYTPLIIGENETIRQRLSRIPKPLVLVILITMAISYYYEVYKAPAPQNPSAQVSDRR